MISKLIVVMIIGESAVGSATINMTELLTTEVRSLGPGFVRALDNYIPIFARINEENESKIQLVGSLHYSLILEEFHAASTRSLGASVHDSNSNHPELVPSCDRGSQAYHVAWELESWKRKEQEQFKEALMNMEVDRRREVECKLAELVEQKEVKKIITSISFGFVYAFLQTFFSHKQKAIVQMEKKLEQVYFLCTGTSFLTFTNNCRLYLICAIKRKC